MASEDTLIQVRQEKHQQLNGETYPLANDKPAYSVYETLRFIDMLIREEIIKTTIVLDEVRGSNTHTMRGRISAFRKSGALTFLNLTDETGHIQLVATRNNLSDYDNLKLLDLGDIVEITGEPVLTKTGERSILLSEWKVLSKSRRPTPEKFAGIADPELKYRKRYLDLMSSEESRARFLVRSEILYQIRLYMGFEGFHEVETSTLNAIASGATAKPFITHHNALDTDLRLRIAPELYLKRLLVGGFDKVYEIGRAYRNEGIDTRHNPEFTIMECYEAYGNFPRLLTFTKDLLRTIDATVPSRLRGPTKEYYEKWQKERPFTLKEFKQTTMKEAVEKATCRAGITLEWNGSTANDLWAVKLWDREFKEQDLSRREKIDEKALLAELDRASTRGEKLAILFEYIAEPFLTEDYRTADGSKSVPVFITEHPKAVSPLARSNDTDPNIVDRFELYIEGRELANAFQELNDPNEQARRFINQLDDHKDAADFDHDYIEALEHGMPPAIGFGMGVDRLVMLLTNTTSIKDVILFPTLKPVKSE